MAVYKTKHILKLLRIQHGMTQAEIAEYLNIARGSYAKYETGANTPTVENLVKLSELYKVDIHYLLFGMNFKEMMKFSWNEGKQAGKEMGDQIIEATDKKRVRKKKTT